MTDLSRDDPSRDSASSSKEGHIWRDVGVSAEAPARRPANGRMPRGRGFPGCGSLRTQEHARTGPRCMIRTEMWSFSCTQVLFIGVSQAHRAVDQRLRAPRQRTSPATTADQQPRQLPGPATADHQQPRQLPGLVETTPQPPRRANEADAGWLGPVSYSSISLRSPLHSVWNVPSRSTRLYVWAPKKSRCPWMRFAGSSAARTPS